MNLSNRISEWSLILKLILGILTGISIGIFADEKTMSIIASVKYVLGQFIFFTVPLVIVAFIAPAITKLKYNANKMLGAGIGIAYFSAVGAASLAYFSGLVLIPYLSVPIETESLRPIPEAAFKLSISPVMSVMSALVLAILIGMTTLKTKASGFEKLLVEFESMMMIVIKAVVIPTLPLFVASTFAGLAYEGLLTQQLPVFLKVVMLALLGHLVWLAILYSIAGFISGKNPWQVIKHYGPAYLTAIGTMSSAATLPVSLNGARKSKVLSKETVDFMVPLGGTIHLCGSVLTETLFVMVISLMLYGSIPPIDVMAVFILLFGVFAIGAPGVPGGTVMASMGIVVGVLGFDPAGVALLIAIFAIQDSFGTACNVTGDGAITLMLEGIFNKNADQDPAL
ncbi:dicarboxylate/amino acid:cation symporter [Pseudoalteromonas sp. JBTF-M23]|uniref:Dicarboxylate/amino acid:cation symporter n=1 Tax=Pseudoalteromonas caenipelagi TaxID=2726988 RepID=A0A849VJF4_9GAMM|nr:dicarboxylate/amino acid:cation symporter [Pseudoalteromonas caenipelagi]NOU51934.1 dicarboxylate/amino acid:cation symporter [Pseudoalteromonas caenipelagi]